MCHFPLPQSHFTVLGTRLGRGRTTASLWTPTGMAGQARPTSHRICPQRTVNTPHLYRHKQTYARFITINSVIISSSLVEHLGTDGE